MLADGIYYEATRFEEPWPFYIIDNFLDTDLYDTLVSLIDSNFKFVDNWDNKLKYTSVVENLNFPKKKALPLYTNARLAGNIDQNIANKLGHLLPSKYFCTSELILCDPNYSYHPHKDHPSKEYTLVVFLHPVNCNATTLMLNNTKQDVLWRQNRALFFSQKEHGVHNYKNTTKLPRLTLNVYINSNERIIFTVTNNNKNNK